MIILNKTELTPEQTLLLYCARGVFDSDCREQLCQLVQQTKLDWKSLFKMAQTHRLLPLLYEVFSSIPAAELPDFVLQELRRWRIRNIGHNFSLVQELIKFLAILETHHIKAITFKGPMIAIQAYGDLSLRTFADLDLLVHPDDFLKVRDIAVSHGYKCDQLMVLSERSCLDKLDSHEKASYFKSQKEFSLFNPENRIFLDIHQGILSKQFSPLFDTTWIWKYSQTVDIGGHQMLGLTPELEILVSCAQGAEEHWPQLGKICDIAMLLNNHPNLDLDGLIELSKKLDILPRVLLGFSLVQVLCGIVLPDHVQAKIDSSPSIQRLTQAVQKRLFLKKQTPTGSKLTLSSVIYQLQLMRSWKNRIRFVLMLMNPTLADIAAMPLPKPLFFIYYVLRPLRLLQQIFWRQLDYQ